MGIDQEECKNLIFVLRTKRHNFLNHLWVIVGYLQLNRHQRAEEYAREAIAKVSAGSTLFSLEPPSLALCCFLNWKKAEDMRVCTSFNLDSQIRNKPNMVRHEK